MIYLAKKLNLIAKNENGEILQEIKLIFVVINFIF